VQHTITPAQIGLVKGSFARISLNPREIGTCFYTRLFELDPKLQVLFGASMREQGQALFTMIDLVVRILDFQQQLVPIIYDLGRRHAAYGVSESDYLTFRNALLDTLETALGEHFTPEVRDAWGAAYDFMKSVMEQAHAHVRQGRTLPFRKAPPIEEELDQ
jgi:hemoglobin-like flavoprotein